MNPPASPGEALNVEASVANDPTASDPGAVEVRAVGLVKKFGDREALAGVDVTVPRGVCTALFGANGSGKTTFVKLVSTLIRPTEGTLEVGGEPLPRRAARVRSRIGLVLDRPFLPADLPLEDGLGYFAELHGLRDARAAIDTWIDRVGLTWRRRDPIRTFSRGMAQRASLATALLPDPELLLLDEPFTALDPSGCELVESLIQESVAKRRSVLLVTHDLERGYRMAEQIIVFRAGQVLLAGDKSTVSFEDLCEALR